MDNPFTFGKVVSGDSFTDREEELREITADILASQNIFLYSPRRYGKTSLMKKIMAKIKDDNVIKIYVDFFQVYSRKRFIEIYSREIAREFRSKLEQILDFFKSHVRNVVPTITLDEQGNPEFKLKFAEKAESSDILLTEILDLPGKLSEAKDKKAVIVFDEFQEIGKLNGESFEKELRSVIQHHENISYIFMGSRVHLLLNMFKSKDRALYNIGKTVNLQKIGREELSRFIEHHFINGTYEIAEEMINRICNMTSDHPYYTQMLCHQLWYEGSSAKIIDLNVLEKAIEAIVINQNEYFLKTWESLPGNQKKILIGLVRSGGKEILSQHYRQVNDFPAASSVERAASALIEKGILDKNAGIYEIPDPFFSEWLKRNIL